MEFKNAYYLPSGRIFALKTDDNYTVECTEMRDVATDSKNHEEVRNSLDPKVIWKHVVPYKEKWLLTVSTQKGCLHNCKFCDVAPLPFKGNLTTDEILAQVNFLLNATPYVQECKKVKIGFARMGEPAHNLKAVLTAVYELNDLSNRKGRKFKWLPCFNTILPERTLERYTAKDIICAVLNMKENLDGFLHFQISVNSTDEEKRKDLFGGAEVLPLEEIIAEINKYEIRNRTVTLNFIVMDGIEIDVNKLKKMGLTKEKFSIKLIPMNRTDNGEINNLKTYANYATYDRLIEFSKQFESLGIKVVTDSIARCEEAGLCCGQLASL